MYAIIFILLGAVLTFIGFLIYANNKSKVEEAEEAARKKFEDLKNEITSTEQKIVTAVKNKL